MPAAGFDFVLDDSSIGDLINFIYGLNGSEGAPAADAAPEGR